MYNEEEIARPYAKALVQAAHEMGCLDVVRGDIEALQAQWEGSELFREWAHAFHSLPRKQHQELVDSIWGDSMSYPTLVLLEALSVNGLLATIPHVVRIFRRMADRAEGRVKVTFVFAVEPKEATVKLLTEKALRAYGEQTQIEVRVDDRLGAGLVVRAGHMQMDGSLAGRLRRLRNAFAQ